jgi:hypothetical protein
MIPPIPGAAPITKRIKHIAPVQLGIVLAVLYGMLALVFAVPMMIIFSLASIIPSQNAISNGPGPGIHASGAGLAAVGGVFFVIMIPVIYAALGFIGGIIAAAIYNVTARFTGGIEFTLADPPS